MMHPENFQFLMLTATSKWISQVYSREQPPVWKSALVMNFSEADPVLPSSVSLNTALNGVCEFTWASVSRGLSRLQALGIYYSSSPSSGCGKEVLPLAYRWEARVSERVRNWLKVSSMECWRQDLHPSGIHLQSACVYMVVYILC